MARTKKFRLEPPPIATLAILIALVLAYAAQIASSTGLAGIVNGPDAESLIYQGGLFKGLVVDQGQWTRLLSSTLMHGGILHLALNGYALWMAGSMLEPLLGKARFFSLYFIGALGGSLLSLALNPENQVSVGASGAIMGLFSSAFTLTFRLPKGDQKAQTQAVLLQVLIPSLIPLASSLDGGKIDYAGHLGGALAGLAGGLAFYGNWPLKRKEPPFKAASYALASLAMGLFAFSLFSAARDFPGLAKGIKLMPDEVLPKTDEEGVKRAAELVRDYPEDPRALIFSAIAAEEAGKLTEAETSLRNALANRMALANFGQELEDLLNRQLAFNLFKQDRKAEARIVAKGLCGSSEGLEMLKLRMAGLCP